MAKILVIEDSALMKVYLRRCLENHGYEVEDWTPLSAMEIPDKITDSAPDLVITDYLMPHMNGLELVARLRARGFDRPIILTSGRLQDVSAAERARVRIDGVLGKPFVLREVGELVARVAAEARMSHAAPLHIQVTSLPDGTADDQVSNRDG